MSEIKVSICCLAYNHEAFIRQCLDGFVMQQTNFAFEVLIHDDASTDNTRAIIEEYHKKYPKIIKPILQKENQYSKGVSGTFTHNFPRALGKYIAICEGDDYWIDPLKLQKQVDFLESNQDYGVVHTDADVYYQNTSSLKKNVNQSHNRNLLKLDNPAEELILGSYAIYTLTTMFKKSLLDKLELDEFKKYKMNDLPMWLTFTKHAKFFYMNESTAVYRKYDGSVSNPTQKKAKLDFKISSKQVRLLFAKSLKLKPKTVNIISDQYYRAVLRKKFEDKESFEALKVYTSLKQKSLKDVILLLGSKSKVFNKIVKAIKPNIS